MPRIEDPENNMPSLSAPAHALSCEDLAAELGANTVDGLTKDEAHCRLDTYGLNEVGDGSSTSLVNILVRQMANAMMLVCIFSIHPEKGAS